ncbi:MAG TPA: PocR ligand-binding domain-containing protein [Anaeromyxobacter sp.]
MRLGDLLDLSVLGRLAEANYRASGMPVGIVDAIDGAVLVGSGWQEICTRFHRAHPLTLERCHESDQHMASHLAAGAPCEYTCKNGLRDIGVPIMVGDEHLATLFLGQFFYEAEAPDREFFARQAREIGFDETAYLAALDRVPVFSRAAVENMLTYNSMLARFISDLAEAALRRRRAEDRAESLARFPEENPDPVLRISTDLDVLYANEAARASLRPLGVEQGEAVPPIISAIVERARAHGQRTRDEVSAGDRIFSLSVVPVRDGFNVYAHDVTARERAEQALLDGEERLRGAMQRLESLLENSPLAVVEWSSVDFRIARWSEGATRMFGWTAEETFGRRIDELTLVYPEDWPLVEQVMADMLSGKRPRNVNTNRNVRKDGGIVHCEWYNSTVTDAGGHLIAVLSLVLDVTDRKRVEQELRDASRRKDEFLGMLSHELRNPLAPIHSALYILDHADPAGPQARRAREVAGRQLSHLTRLVDDLLDVTRIVRGKIELRTSTLDLAEVTRRAGEDYAALMTERGLELVTTVPAEPVWVTGDETRLAQAMGNLLQNAAKFTPPGGRVTLSVVATGDAAEVHVRDTGRGIDRDLMSRIFDPFVQADQALDRTDGGLGLGLALVKGLVQLHGGTVSAMSAGPGTGADFAIRLPPSGNASAPARVAEAGTAPPASARSRILVVDDNPDAAESLADLVRLLGHDAEVAFDGASGLAKARGGGFDVVLCDIGLPGMSGYEVARELRRDHGHRMRLIAVSGYAQPEDVQRSVEAGFDAHVAKPPDLERLETLLGA